MSQTVVCDTWLLGCAHVSKTDGFQSLDLQRDALRAQPLPRLRLRPPRRPAGSRQSACAPCGRATCSWSGSSTASAATSPIWSTPCRTCRPAGWACRQSSARLMPVASRGVWRALATSIPVDELQFGARLEGDGFDGTVVLEPAQPVVADGRVGRRRFHGCARSAVPRRAWRGRRAGVSSARQDARWSRLRRPRFLVLLPRLADGLESFQVAGLPVVVVELGELLVGFLHGDGQSPRPSGRCPGGRRYGQRRRRCCPRPGASGRRREQALPAPSRA